MKRMLTVLLVAATLAVGAQERRLPPTGGERRAALVIGNDGYATVPLRNARNDANAMAGVLAQLGFDVTTALDTDRVSLERTIRTFIGKLGTAEVGFFFYAGHGVQIEGENYLVPVDFDAQDEPEAKAKAYPLDLLRSKMDTSGARLKIIVLDACRDNPFRFARSGSRGLGTIEPGRGTLIAFATGPGKTASDNAAAGNGLFTQQLLKNLTEPGLKVQDVFDRARVAVDQASGSSQTPWVNSNVIGEFYLVSGPANPAPGGGVGVGVEVELAFWAAIKDSRNARDYEAYLAQYPKGSFAVLARNRVEELHGSVAPAARPAAAAPCGDVAACLALGQRHATGEGAPKDTPRAIEAYRVACEGGSAEACRWVGLTLFNGQGVAADQAAGVSFLDRGCEGGSASACHGLGTVYRDGQGVAKDSTRAAWLFQKACDGGSAIGCNDLGNRYGKGDGVQKNLDRSRELYQKACEGGEAKGCYNLGTKLEHGEGVAKDLSRAAGLYEKGCEKGHVGCCAGLGYFYHVGIGGLPRDMVRAVELYDMACKGGNATTCSNLGVLLQKAEGGVPKDLIRAAELYRRGCELGEWRSCYNLGVTYRDAIGVPQDTSRANALFEKACAAGDASGCKALGR